MSDKRHQAEKLLYAIGDLDDDLVIAAQELQGQLRPTLSLRRLERYGVLAAGLILCLGLWGVGRLFFGPYGSAAPKAQNSSSMAAEAPMEAEKSVANAENAPAPAEAPAAMAPNLSAPEAENNDRMPQNSSDMPSSNTLEESPEGAWGSSLRAQSSSQLLSANPWRGQAQSLAVYVLAQQPTPEERLLTVASQLGLDSEKLSLSQGATSAPEALWSAQTEAGELLAYADQTVELRLAQPRKLKVALDQETVSSLEPLEELAQELLADYGALLPYEEPVWALEGLGVNEEQRPCWSIVFYEGSGTAEEQLLSYSCGAVRFLFDGEGALASLSSQETVLGESLYSRELLEEEAAQTQLLSEETVVQAQLRYRRRGELLEPVYCFTLEGEQGEDGLYLYREEIVTAFAPEE